MGVIGILVHMIQKKNFGLKPLIQFDFEFNLSTAKYVSYQHVECRCRLQTEMRFTFISRMITCYDWLRRAIRNYSKKQNIEEFVFSCRVESAN